MGASLFDDLAAPFADIEDGAYGEAFNYTPMRKPPNSRPVADSSRVAIPGLIGIWLDPPTVISAGTMPRYAGDNPRVVVQVYRFNGKDPKEGDSFQRIADQTTYEARNPEYDGFGKVTLELIETAA